ncbi:hypothetical protein SAMN05192582_106721 [Bacteroides ovatus]|mgnify:CR=1 FL=1|uniref:Uncharacterized protein n=1 Tax=Bacteroides ovatus TaxID=28116 RepID=A0A1G8MTQ8_BACOV|nr:hypothetical protein SAMN05192582_106721 [Bacteroides ovatus]
MAMVNVMDTATGMGSIRQRINHKLIAISKFDPRRNEVHKAQGSKIMIYESVLENGAHSLDLK